MRRKWDLVSVRLEIVLVLVKDRCMVCSKQGSEIILTHPLELLADEAQVKSRSVRLDIVLVLVQDRCTVCA